MANQQKLNHHHHYHYHHQLRHQASFLVFSRIRAQHNALILTFLLVSLSQISFNCANFVHRTANEQPLVGRQQWSRDLERLYSNLRASNSGSRASSHQLDKTNLNELLRQLASSRNQRSSSLTSYYLPSERPQLVLDDYSNENSDELLLRDANSPPIEISKQSWADYSPFTTSQLLSSDNNHYFTLPAARLVKLLSEAPQFTNQNKLTDNFLYSPADEPIAPTVVEGEQESHQNSARDFYRLDNLVNNKINEDERQNDEKPAVKLTTLLESEETNTTTTTTTATTTSSPVADRNNTSVDIADKKEVNNNSTKTVTTTENDIQSSTTPSYGYVSNNKEPVDPVANLWSVSSMFSNLYKSLASLLPNYNNQQQQQVDSTNATTLTISKKATPTHGTKQSVSDTASVEPRRRIVNSISSDDGVDDDNISMNELEKGKKLALPSISETKTIDGNYLNSELDHANVVPIQKQLSSTFYANDDKRFLSAVPTTTSDHHSSQSRVSLMRQSNFALPYGDPDDQLVSGSEPKHTVAYGNYLVSHPTTPHHYPLGMMNWKDDPIGKMMRQPNDLDTDQVYGQISQRPYLRHLHPGESVYSSYSGPLRPLYQTGENNNLASKTNDVYFLVMVVAFCAMAMAVVLSAGLFAYRVQQSRKSTSEQDYPTYGVVGPNNINGKCAASFVGGYFGSAGVIPAGGLPSSSSSSSKTVSTKYHPDFIDSGVAGNNSKSSSMKSRISGDQIQSVAAGTQQTGRSNSGFIVDNQNAARMYHYQHQKQQMIISDRASTGRHTSASDLDSDDENEEGSYTVYECPGLASAHEMEIKNPLFNDDQTQQ